MPDAPRILLVDDDRKIVQAVAIRLKAAGFEIIHAYDGQQGLDQAKAEHPDVIVLDIRMPGIDGLEVLERLKSQSDTQSIPVVVLSASVVDQTQAIQRGARSFLEKPYDAKQLVAAIVDAASVASREH